MHRLLLACLILPVFVLFSCQEEKHHSNRNLTLDAFSEMKTQFLAVNSQTIRKHLSKMTNQDAGRMNADRRTRAYYQQKLPFLWIDRHGVDDRADSLVQYLEKVGETGIMPDMYRVSQIKDDLNRLRSLSLTEDNDVNRVMARLEYNLTRAYFRYVSCQHFGYVNPTYTLNHYVKKDSDSIRTTYKFLYDVKTMRPDDNYFLMAYQKVNHDSVAPFLKEIQPHGTFYNRLVNLLNSGKLSCQERLKVVSNIEKCRWQTEDSPEMHQKYVLVNIPSFRLYAYDEDSVLTMKVGCGKLDTRTPLIYSYIKRIQVSQVPNLPVLIDKFRRND